MKYEDMISEKQASRLVAWCKAHGHTEDEAYECLAYVMNAKDTDNKEGQEVTARN